MVITMRKRGGGGRPPACGGPTDQGGSEHVCGGGRAVGVGREARRTDVVDVAESGRLRTLCVVEAARPVDGNVGEPVVELHGAVDGAAGVHAAVVVEPVEHGAVVADGELLELLGKLVLVIGRDALDEVNVVGRVELGHLLGGGQVWPVYLELLVQLVREDEVVRHLEAVWLHRVARAVVVGSHRVGVMKVADLLFAARRHVTSTTHHAGGLCAA